MTVNTSTAQAQYVGNGVSQTFAIPFYFLVDTDIKISKKTAATGAVSVLTLNSDYTLTGAGNGAGGSATLVVAPASGDQILIERNVVAVQQTAYPSNSVFPSASHEMALDRLTMLVQQLQVAGSRTLTRGGLATTYDLQNNTLVNGAAAVNPQDVPNLQQMQTAIVAGAAAQLVLPVGSSLVGFQQAGTGAVSRTVQDKARELVSVKDFGATGDGSTDDTAAITRAFTYANSLAVPCCVYFPSGSFKVTAGFTVGINVSVRGQGRGSSTILVSAANVTVFSNVQTTATSVNISISDLSIVSAVAATIGINFTLCKQTSIANMTFAGCQQNIVIDRGSYHQIDSLIISGYGSNAMGTFRFWSSVDTDYVYSVTMRNVILNNTGTGLNTTVDPASLYLRRGITCYFSHYNAGDLADGTTGHGNLWVIENDCQGCKFSDCIGVFPYLGIVISQGSGVAASPSCIQFDSIDIDQPTQCAIQVNAGKYITFNGGFVTPRGGFQAINPVVFNGGSYITVNGMLVYGFNQSAGSGFYFNGATYVTITNCVVDFCWYALVFAGGNHIKVFNCDLTNCNNKYNGTYAAAGNHFANNDGFNPFSVAAPAFPASGTPYTNILGVRCTVFVAGTTITAYSINGTTIPSLAGSQTVDLEPGDTITLTYTGTPSWTWVGH